MTDQCPTQEQLRQFVFGELFDDALAPVADHTETCEVCPGSGKGKLVGWDEIEAQRKVIRV